MSKRVGKRKGKANDTPKAYRCDILACPANLGKCIQVGLLLGAWQAGVRKEMHQAWLEWWRTGAFRSMKETGPRPVSTALMNAAFGQMCMTQTRDALRGWVACLTERVRQRIERSQLPADLRHQLHSLNLQEAWGGGLWWADNEAFQPGSGAVNPAVAATVVTATVDSRASGCESAASGDSGNEAAAPDEAIVFVLPNLAAPPRRYGVGKHRKPISVETQRLFRHIVKSLRKQTTLPDLRRLWPRIDQRCATLLPAKAVAQPPVTAADIAAAGGGSGDAPSARHGHFDFWLRLATLDKGQRIELPLVSTPLFRKRIQEAGGFEQVAKTIQILPMATGRAARNRKANGAKSQAFDTACPAFHIAVFTDSEPAFAKSRETYAREIAEYEAAAAARNTLAVQAEAKPGMDVVASKQDRDTQGTKTGSNQARSQRLDRLAADCSAAAGSALPTSDRVRPHGAALAPHDGAVACGGPGALACSTPTCKSHGQAELPWVLTPTRPMAPLHLGGDLALDLGLVNLFGTNEGDLLGRNWMKALQRLDAQINGLAAYRQKHGLKVRSPRYDRLVQRLRGFVKTEVNRILNALVARRKPTRLILEALGQGFQHQARGRLSRRMCRLVGLVGKRAIETKLADLTQHYGILVEYRHAAYTSQECSACGYPDKRNRTKQSTFHCRYCGTRLHADVNAPRVLVRQRLPDTKGSTRSSRERLLHARVTAFMERYPFPSGSGPAPGRPCDPRLDNPYFKDFLPKSKATAALNAYPGAVTSTGFRGTGAASQHAVSTLESG